MDFVNWIHVPGVVQITNERMDIEEQKYPNLWAHGHYFHGIPFYVSTDGRKLPRNPEREE